MSRCLLCCVCVCGDHIQGIGEAQVLTAPSPLSPISRLSPSLLPSTAQPMWSDLEPRAGPCRGLVHRLYEHMTRQQQQQQQQQQATDAEFYRALLDCCAVIGDVDLAEKLRSY